MMSGRAMKYPTRMPAIPKIFEKVRMIITSLPAMARWLDVFLGYSVVQWI